MPKDKLIPMQVGDTKKIGEKEYELDESGALRMQVPVVFRQSYTRDGLEAKLIKLQAEITEVNALLAKLDELESAP
jgi:hypothetical protein